MSWKDNPIMEWYDPRPGSATYNQWVKISDHGRSPLSISVERIENSQRMANGSLRRFVVAKKRIFSISWQNIPDGQTSMLAGGKPGRWMEEFHNQVNGDFRMRLRAGKDISTATVNLEDSSEYRVMITDFSRDVVKRGPVFDLWDLDMSLEEV